MNPGKPRTSERGRAGEDAAADFLQRRGLCVIERNWRWGPLELDIICRDGDTLVFVEVRLRRAGGPVAPVCSVTPAKRRNFIRAARAYLAHKGDPDAPCRFDLICVVDTGATLQLEHHRHVLALCETVGRGDAAWQPW